MIHDKVVTLIKRLLSATQANKLEWRTTSSADRFSVAFADRLVTISCEEPFLPDPEGAPDYALSIINGHGDMIEKVTDNDLRPEWDKSFFVMRELFESARRSAMGADKAVDEILATIEKLDQEDFPF